MARPARLHRITTIAVAAGGLLFATLTPVASAASSAAKDPAPPPVPARYLNQAIDWAPCWFDEIIKDNYPAAPTTRCASVRVPMDWNRPNAHPDITVAIAFSRATGTSKGLLTSNPGGPGGAGLTLTAALGLSKTKMFTDYDLLGFDPRGFGESTNLQCLTTEARLAALPTTVDYRIRNAQTHRTEIAEARLFADACSATEFAPFVSTQQTVYDMDFLRALLHYRHTNFIGYSYGTWLGSWYADTFPSRTGRMILDSNMNWVATHYDNFTTDPLSFQRRRDAMLFPWIARHHDLYHLGTTAKQVEARYERIRAGLVELARAGGPVPSYAMDNDVAGLIYSNSAFPDAAEAIGDYQSYVESADAEALAGARADRTTNPLVRAADRPMTPRQALDRARRSVGAASADAVVDLGPVGTTVRCNDSTWNDHPWKYVQDTDRFTKRYPFVGYFNGVPFCALWPYQPARDRVIDLPGVPRILMIQAEGDPATAYEGALVAHRQNADVTRFVAIDDEGQHGQYVGGPSRCAEHIGDRFLFTGEAPGSDRICGTTPLPLDQAVYPFDGPLTSRAAQESGPSASPSVASQLIAKAASGRF